MQHNEAVFVVSYICLHGRSHTLSVKQTTYHTSSIQRLHREPWQNKVVHEEYSLLGYNAV
jgi:hypothetical protein